MKNPNVPTDTSATVSETHPAVVGYDVKGRQRITSPDVRPCSVRGMGDVNARRWITLPDVRPCPIRGMNDVDARRWITVFDVRPCPIRRMGDVSARARQTL